MKPIPSDSDVKEIRRLLSLGNYSQQQIADMFHISQPHVSELYRNKEWR